MNPLHSPDPWASAAVGVSAARASAQRPFYTIAANICLTVMT
jgi:hypothetical protein